MLYIIQFFCGDFHIFVQKNYVFYVKSWKKIQYPVESAVLRTSRLKMNKKTNQKMNKIHKKCTRGKAVLIYNWKKYQKPFLGTDENIEKKGKGKNAGNQIKNRTYGKSGRD